MDRDDDEQTTGADSDSDENKPSSKLRDLRPEKDPMGCEKKNANPGGVRDPAAPPRN